MTISAESYRNEYNGNDSTTVFPYTFRIVAEDHLRVTIADSDDVETELILDTDYTVDGVGESGGGNVNYPISGDPLPSGSRIVSVRNTPLKQLSDFENQGPYLAESTEDALDYLTMLCQQLQEQIDRSLMIPVTSTITGEEYLSDIASIEIGSSAAQAAAEAAQAAAEAASAAAVIDASDASDSADLAAEWATKTTDKVQSIDYSSKEWAIGVLGRGIASSGSAKDWAIYTANKVDDTGYSSKEWAIGVQTRGVSGGGSSKDWATYTTNKVDDTGYSSKEWAIGILTRGASGGGSAKDWASYTGGKVDDTEYSAKYYAEQAALSGGGAGGTVVQWGDRDLTNAAPKDILRGVESFVFNPDDFSLTIQAQVLVPDSYDVGQQISIGGAYSCADGGAGNVLLRSTATLIRPGTDALSSTTNQHVSTNTVLANVGAEIPSSVDFDICAADGKINSVALSPGDIIKLTLQLITGSTTYAGLVYFHNQLSEVKLI